MPNRLPDPPPVKVRLRSFSRSLPMSLLRAREAVMQRFRQPLNVFNLTEQQWRVLRALSSVPAIEVTSLARATNLLAPSLSRILRDLLARGLVERRAIDNDMRKSLIAIAPDGLTLIEAVAPYSEEIYGEITEAFGAAKLAQLQDLLQELADTANSLPAYAIPDGLLTPEVLRIVGEAPGRGRRASRPDGTEPEVT